MGDAGRRRAYGDIAEPGARPGLDIRLQDQRLRFRPSLCPCIAVKSLGLG